MILDTALMFMGLKNKVYIELFVMTIFQWVNPVNAHKEGKGKEAVDLVHFKRKRKNRGRKYSTNNFDK